MKEDPGQWPYMAEESERTYVCLVAGIGLAFALYTIGSRVFSTTFAHEIEDGVVYYTYITWWWLLVTFLLTLISAFYVRPDQAHLLWFRRKRLFYYTATLLILPAWGYAWGVMLVGAALATLAAEEISRKHEDLPLNFWATFLHERTIHVMNLVTMGLLLIPLTRAMRYSLWQQWQWLAGYVGQNLRVRLAIFSAFHLYLWPQWLPMLYFIFFDVEKVYGISTGVEPRAWRSFLMYLIIMAISVLATVPLLYFYMKSPATDDPEVLHMRQALVPEDSWHNTKALELRESLSLLAQIDAEEGDERADVVPSRLRPRGRAAAAKRAAQPSVAAHTKRW